jgi:adenylate cyclase
MQQKIKHLSFTTSIVLSFCIFLLIIVLRLIGIFEQTELNLFDFYYKIAPNEARDERIILVGITEDDIAKLKTNRLSDWQLYQILSQIKKGNPAAVGIDIFRDHPVPPNYWELQELQKQGISALNSNKPFGNREFLSIFYDNPNFFAIGKQAGIEGDKDFDLISPPPVPIAKIADIGVARDSDGTQRRGLVYPITKEPAVPSLSWALAQRYLEQQKAKIETIERNNELHIKINNTMFWKFRNYTGAYVRADEGGYQVLLNWRKSNFMVVSVSDVLENKVSPLVFKGRIVIIGAYAPSLNDQFLTPLNPEWFGSPRRIYGIEAIAQVSSYILAAVLDGRPTLQTWREPWISFVILTCGLITGYFFKRIPVEQLNVSLGLILLIDISLFGLFYRLLSIGYWFSVLPLILVISLTATVHYIIRTTLKRKSDDEQQKDYSRKLENMIEKRQHYRIVYNSFLSLGEKIAQPLQSLLLSNQRWIEYEELFISFLDKINISDVEKYEFKKFIAQLMIEVSKAKEFTKLK